MSFSLLRVRALGSRLDGGLQQWSQALQTGRATPPEISNFTLRPALTRLYSSDQVLAAIQQPVATRPRLVDARSHERFAGKDEPIYPVANPQLISSLAGFLYNRAI